MCQAQYDCLHCEGVDWSQGPSKWAECQPEEALDLIIGAWPGVGVELLHALLHYTTLLVQGGPELGDKARHPGSLPPGEACENPNPADLKSAFDRAVKLSSAQLNLNKINAIEARSLSCVSSLDKPD